MNLKNFLSDGNNVWTSALNQMESTLKGIEVLLCKNKYRIFYKQIPVFWVPPSYIPVFTQSDSGIQKFIGGYTCRHTDGRIISYAYFQFFKIRKVG
jgi:hypothetical protein